MFFYEYFKKINNPVIRFKHKGTNINKKHINNINLAIFIINISYT